MTRRFTMPTIDTEPRVFYRITDNWLELGCAFHHDIVGFPPLRYAPDTTHNGATAAIAADDR